MKKKKRNTLLLLLLLALPLILMYISNYSIEKYAQNKTFSDVSIIEKNKVGLVLGTSKLLKNGGINLYFRYRVAAAVELYKNGKIDFVLVSGDNRSKDNDEPTDFKNELIIKGVPENKIFLDYAGFRTLDSVVRAKAIFGQEKITMISQEFHNKRAIYLAKVHGITAIGFNAKGIPRRYGWKVELREYLARTKVFIDILFRVKPHFLGEKIEIK